MVAEADIRRKVRSIVVKEEFASIQMSNQLTGIVLVASSRNQEDRGSTMREKEVVDGLAELIEMKNQFEIEVETNFLVSSEVARSTHH